MKRSVRYLLVLLLAVALTPVKAFSQQVNNKQADEALRQKAYALLESLADQIGSLQSGENRARLGSNIAGSLWAHNEPKAREMFATVTKEIRAGFVRDERDTNSGRTIANFVKLRADTALRIGLQDPEWAMRFLEETRPEKVKIGDKERDNLNLQLAYVVAAKNPELALKLGSEAASHGVSDLQLTLLRQLEQKSHKHASALLAEIVKVAPNLNIRYSLDNEQFYFALARLFEPSLGRDPAFRDLMKYFIDVGLSSGCDKDKQADNETYHFCYRLGLVVPLMEKVDAKRVAPLKHLARKSAFPYEWSPELTEYAEAYQNGSVEDLLAMIPKSAEFAGLGQMAVIRKLLESGEFDRARKIIDGFKLKPADKQEVLKQIDDEQRIVNEDTSAELLKEATEQRSEDETFAYLFRKATDIGPRNPQTTVKLLDRASEYLDKVPAERWQMQWRIGIAARYCQVRNERCFRMAEEIIRRMNELVSAAAKLNGFDNHYLRQGEWNMTAEGGVGSLLTGLAQNAVYFGLCDFDRAVALTSQFERPEIRLMAQLKLAQGVLEGPPKKPLFPPYEG